MSDPGLRRQANAVVSRVVDPTRTVTCVPGRSAVGSVTTSSAPMLRERSRMIFSPCESLRGACWLVPSSRTSISANGGRMVQRSQRLAAPECLRALAMASWAIRSSSYSTSEGSRGPCSSSVTCTAMGEVVLTWLAYADRLSPRPAVAASSWRRSKIEWRSSVTTRVTSVRSCADALLLLGIPGAGGQVVDEVPERRDVLGDPVVDLARDPLPFLAGGGVAHPAEQQCRLELHGVPGEPSSQVDRGA